MTWTCNHANKNIYYKTIKRNKINTNNCLKYINKNDYMIVVVFRVVGIVIERNSSGRIKQNGSLCDGTMTKQISKEIYVGFILIILIFWISFNNIIYINPFPNDYIQRKCTHNYLTNFMTRRLSKIKIYAINNNVI